MHKYKPIKAPHGNKIVCKNWGAESAMRMLMNNLDPEVAKEPEKLIVYGGKGKAARNWECYYKIVETLKVLEEDETLLMQSGKPVAVFKTHSFAPRVLITNSLLVPKWATFEEFTRLESMGLTTYGQMTAGSWIYIGTQGILQGTYETLAAIAKIEYGGTLRGKWVLTAGLGEMGGAQPLAVTMNDGVAVVAEVKKSQIERKINERYCDVMATSIKEAIRLKNNALKNNKPISIGLLGNAAEILPEMHKMGELPDIVTDQTSAHDPLNGYYPLGMEVEEADDLRAKNPVEYMKRAYESMAVHCQAMLDFQKSGSRVFEYGNNLRERAKMQGILDAFEIEGYVPKYIRPLFSEGSGPFRWAALSGDPEDIYKTDEAILKTYPHKELLVKWIKMARERIKFQGLPSRICWLAYKEREEFAHIINNMVKKGDIKAPVAIGRDHHDTGSVASPNRETERMLDGSDAIADWPILNAMLNVASGATWVSLHHGGGVGIGYSIHSGVVLTADGTDMAEKKISLVLNNDPATGVVRHADAGYEIAINTAKKYKINMPML